MFLKYRPVRVEDLEECSRCIPDGAAYDEVSRRQLILLWRELLCSGAANAAVMEDQFAPRGKRIVWFCFKVFVSDAYALYLKTDAPPFIGAEILRNWKSGMSPLMTLPEIRRANSGPGVNIVVLNSGAPPRVMEGDNLTMLADRVIDFTWYFSSGYNCRELLEEFYDDFMCRWAENAGFGLRTDYSSYFERHPERRPIPGEHPRLYGISRYEADTRPGSLASLIFRWNPPRFYFRPVEQALLTEALLGETDEDLAESLGIALVTVRKRWDNIYERVQDVAPEVFHTASSAGNRAGEKKRRLLSYLRQHVEELRPLEPERAPSFERQSPAAPFAQVVSSQV